MAILYPLFLIISYSDLMLQPHGCLNLHYSLLTVLSVSRSPPPVPYSKCIQVHPYNLLILITVFLLVLFRYCIIGHSYNVPNHSNMPIKIHPFLRLIQLLIFSDSPIFLLFDTSKYYSQNFMFEHCVVCL